MLNSQRDSAAGFLIEDEVLTGFCGFKFLSPRLRVIDAPNFGLKDFHDPCDPQKFYRRLKPHSFGPKKAILGSPTGYPL
jgi:hypothetical protein